MLHIPLEALSSELAALRNPNPEAFSDKFWSMANRARKNPELAAALGTLFAARLDSLAKQRASNPMALILQAQMLDEAYVESTDKTIPNETTIARQGLALIPELLKADHYAYAEPLIGNAYNELTDDTSTPESAKVAKLAFQTLQGCIDNCHYDLAAELIEPIANIASDPRSYIDHDIRIQMARKLLEVGNLHNKDVGLIDLSTCATEAACCISDGLDLIELNEEATAQLEQIRTRGIKKKDKASETEIIARIENIAEEFSQ